MDVENQEIADLMAKRLAAEREINRLERAIGDLQRQCNPHVRANYTHAWWCQKCGGAVPESRESP